MKKRHLVMLSILALFILILFAGKGTKSLTCTTNGEFYLGDSTSELKAKIKDDKVINMNLVILVSLPEEYILQKQSIIDNINSQGKMVATSTKDGIRLKAGMSSGYFENLGLSKDTSYADLKHILELQGYKCK